MSSLFGGGEVTPRSRWFAVIAASMLMQLPYWVATFAFVAAHEDEPVPGAPVLFALGFVPLVFLLLAFGSRHPRAPGATLKAMGLFLLVTPPVVLLNPVVGLVAGFGAGGILTLRPPDLPRVTRTRVVALALACVYLYLLLVVFGAGVFAIVSGAALPFGVLGIADELLVGRAEQADREASEAARSDDGADDGRRSRSR
jgi:hypothetical protein